jgi:hypothetical protein
MIVVHAHHIEMLSCCFEQPFQLECRAVETRTEDEMIGVMFADGSADRLEISVPGISKKIVAVPIGDGLSAMPFFQPTGGGNAAMVCWGEFQILIEHLAVPWQLVVGEMS